MAEPCDPEVLHARVSVLESNDARHDRDITQLWKETNDLKLCAQCLPAISSDLREIKKTVDFLNSCKLSQEGVERGENNFWVHYKEFVQIIVSVGLTAIVTIMLFKMGMKP